jgi:hypothetical protein
MTTLSALARVLAVESGRAVPSATVRHVHLSDRPLVFIPLALAGEACAPLAVMAGTDRSAPRVLIVPQPRDRTQRFTFMAELADVVIGYIEEFLADEEAVAGQSGTEPERRYADAPQILLPNRAGVAFSRLLGRSTRFRRTDGDFAVPAAVPLLGRWLTFLAEQSELPGSCLMLAATEALALHWSTGQSPIEDANLAALLGWIDPPEGMTGREAALAAEDPVRWPPAGPATDPTFDNEVLVPLIFGYDQARSGGSERMLRRARSALEQALVSQLEPTWRLMWRSADLLATLPAGDRVATRWDADRAAFSWHARHVQAGGAPQARRDSAVAAARRLNRLERAQTSYAIQRAFDDPLVMAERRLAGEAFAGQVVAVQPDRVDRSGAKAKLRPLVTVQTADLVQVTAGDAVTSPARPKQPAKVLAVDERDGQPTTVVLELSGGMGRGLQPAPGSVPEPGEAICYARFAESFQPPVSFPEPERTPWTHGGPPEPYVPADEDAQEASQ